MDILIIHEIAFVVHSIMILIGFILTYRQLKQISEQLHNGVEIKR